MKGVSVKSVVKLGENTKRGERSRKISNTGNFGEKALFFDVQNRDIVDSSEFFERSAVRKSSTFESSVHSKSGTSESNLERVRNTFSRLEKDTKRARSFKRTVSGPDSVKVSDSFSDILLVGTCTVGSDALLERSNEIKKSVRRDSTARENLLKRSFSEKVLLAEIDRSLGDKSVIKVKGLGSIAVIEFAHVVGTAKVGGVFSSKKRDKLFVGEIVLSSSALSNKTVDRGVEGFGVRVIAESVAVVFRESAGEHVSLGSRFANYRRVVLDLEAHVNAAFESLRTD